MPYVIRNKLTKKYLRSNYDGDWYSIDINNAKVYTTKQGIHNVVTKYNNDLKKHNSNFPIWEYLEIEIKEKK